MSRKNTSKADREKLTWGIIDCGDVVRRKSGPVVVTS